MDSMRDFFNRIKSRPSIFLLMMLFSLAFSAAEAYNPIIRSYGSFGYIFQHNYMTTLSEWVGRVSDFFDKGGQAYYLIFIGLLFVFIFSMLLSAFFSGYINVLISAVNGNPKKRGEFKEGIKKNFIKTALYIFSFIVLSVIFFFLLLYAVIPAVSMLRMFFDGDTSIIFTMLLISILTVAMMLLAIVFFGMYFSYVLPSIAGFKKSSLRIGLKMGNMYCWYLLPKTALFLFLDALLRVALFIIHYGHSSGSLSVIVLLITTILRTFLYYIYIYFTFNTFIAMRDDLYPEYEDAEYDEYEEAGEEKTVHPERRRNTVKADIDDDRDAARNSEIEDPSEVTYTTGDSESDYDDDDYDDSFDP